MRLRDSYDFENIVNEAERMVVDELERQLDLEVNSGVCTCEDCVLDIAALSLNAVKPVYRVSLLGSLYAGSMENTPYGLEVRTAVEKAIVKVRDNPSHS